MNIKHKEWINSVLRERGGKKTRHNLLRLDKNERVTTFSAGFWRNILKKISQEHIIAYPEPERFYDKLSTFHGYSADHFMVTAGSDAAIKNGFELCVKPQDAVLTLKPTYAMVEVYCDLYSAEKRLIAFNHDLSLNTEALINAIDEKVSLVVLANPNSPTGTFIDVAKMEEIAERAAKFRAVVLIDEAYYGFCPETCISFVKRFKNVMITRTFSKACGLAGLRIGYIIAHPELVSLLYKFRPLYEVNSIALLSAEFILDNWREVESYIEETKKGKAYFITQLERLGFSYADTRTNFLHIDFKKKKKRAKELFERNNIKVREGHMPGFENFLRVTLAPEPVMKKLIKVLEVL
jgi:histidinol-phosphate aminotransferase